MIPQADSSLPDTSTNYQRGIVYVDGWSWTPFVASVLLVAVLGILWWWWERRSGPQGG